MNIKNRLSKLETATNLGNGFCACSSTNKLEIYFADLGADSDDPTPHLADPDRTVPEHCIVCRKPIEKEQIIIQGVDETTKDRFPEHWQAS